MKKLSFIWSLPRTQKRVISLIVDIIFIISAFYLSLWTRLGYFYFPEDFLLWYVLAGTILITLVGYVKLGLYRAILRYLTFHAFTAIFLGAVISSISIASLAYFFNAFIPRTVPIIYLLFLMLLCGGSRLVVRLLLISYLNIGNKAVLVIGAGATGRQLVIALKQSSAFRVEGFIDKDMSLKNTIIQGITVYGIDRLHQLIQEKKIEKVLLAIPKATRSERTLIIDQIIAHDVEVLSVPGFNDIVTGRAKVDELQDVTIGDLLDRDVIKPDMCLMQANITNKVVMITGAGGSIGSELCRQILYLKPAFIILYEQSEFSLYNIDKELCNLSKELSYSIRIIPLLGSVLNKNRLSNVMNTYSVDTVYHAAAYKHVPVVELNVVEGVRNNIFGTLNCVEASIECGVQSFVLISTDKAVRPTNVMGATKRMAELILQSFASEIHKGAIENYKTRFCMVRFGNVLGSSGSVIPVFKKQIEEGKPITVTHPNIVRYFMTIPEAAQLVIQAGAMGQGGDVFVLDMGEPIKIVDLAENLIRLSGLEVKSEINPHGDIEIQFTGLRPGEKLYEELVIGEHVYSTNHSRIKMAKESFLEKSELDTILESLDIACQQYDLEKIRKLLKNSHTEFCPKDNIDDLIWSENKNIRIS